MGKRDGKYIDNIPNQGTVNLNKFVKPTVKAASCLKELHDEFKQFRMLKKKDELASNQEVGTPAYLVSAKWLKNYLNFLCYEKFDQGATEAQITKYLKADHFEK